MGMRNALTAYVATAVVFFAMDFIWLSTAVNGIYRPRIGSLLLERPNLPVAASFYLLYVVEIVVFAVLPALRDGDWGRAAWSGALLGVVAYGTYDMTNLATLRDWSATVSLVDLAWGTVATAVSATIGMLVTGFLARSM